MSIDKRITARQALELLHDYYDDLEKCSLAAAEKALREQFGFGLERFTRFKAAYLDALGEEAEKQAEDFKKKLKRRLR